MNYMGPDNIMTKRKDYFFPATSNFYKNPPQIVSGSMQYVFDHNGKKYIDFFAGVSVMNCGHSNPEVLKDTIEQLSKIQHTTTLYLTQPMVELAEKLSDILPGDIQRTFFCVTGSEANEGAMALARLHTKKNKFIALTGALHGRTHLTLSVTGIPMWRLDDNLVNDNVFFIVRPYSPDSTYEEAMEKSLLQLEAVLKEHGDEICAMILEPLQGNGGIIMYPIDYLKKVLELLHSHNVLLICDEVQTGYGRTGKMFCVEHYDVVPDIIVTAKALGNGIPISTFSTTDEIAKSFNRPSASTFGGNPVAAQTALSVLTYIEKNNLVQRSKELGSYLRQELEKLSSPFIAEVRGAGLMLGIQIKTSNNKVDSAEITDIILEEMKDNGFLIGKNGLNRDVLAFQPPLVIEKEDIASMIESLAKVLEKIQLQYT
ncbi:aspartate aminotransferase family protein [Clostridium folliculivorans]|uniref:alanine--glyoxylate transaminase n=1 Tax=Clostridium folliculivorans TaxID=2886038 RepID=A0A9W6DBL2_9CLOT|nr:aspartate aminotransferase family protein [Clostridium folliculivorans]GKU26550.1 aspartate aminotransferase family protein [Clostridium folliculivorans]GKU29018.1 aspartate aminotransferase family protein [Clostridium folliculivorans]